MLSPSPQPTSPFARLPAELLWRVIRPLSTTELCAVRRTCKAVEFKIFHPFASEFFRKKQFMLSTPSLTAFIHIAKHPTLGPYLKHVCIATDVFDLDTRSPAYRAARDDQDYIINTALYKDLLAEAFAALPGLETIDIRDFNSATRFRDGPHAQWSSLGAPTIRRETGTPLLMLPYSRQSKWLSALFANVIAAAATAGKTPPNVEVILKSHSHGLEDSAFFIHPRIRPSVAPLIAGISRLHIDVFLQSSGHNGQSSPQLPNLRSFLAETLELTWLRFNYRLNSTAEMCFNFLEWLGDDPNALSSTASPPPLASNVSAFPSSPPVSDAPAAASSDLSLVPAPLSPPPVAFRKLTTLDLGFITVNIDVLVKLLLKPPQLVTVNLHKVTVTDRFNPSGTAQQTTAAPGVSSRRNMWAELLSRLDKSGIKRITLNSLAQCLSTQTFSVMFDRSAHQCAGSVANPTIQVPRIVWFKRGRPDDDDMWTNAADSVRVQWPPNYGTYYVGSDDGEDDDDDDEEDEEGEDGEDEDSGDDEDDSDDGEEGGEGNQDGDVEAEANEETSLGDGVRGG